ncbi:MAG: folate family ECF transporter S component [Oscillospiraceae bacterium]|nr:folate family ECF transporter S component [Oscillospiraceae bacterium]
MNKSAKRLVTDGLCAALYVVLAAYLSLNLGPIKLSLDGLPILLGAMLFGPADGLIIGLVGNFLSQLLGPYGISATTILWMLPPALLGLLTGLYAKRHGREQNARRLFLPLLLFLLADTTLTTGVMWVDCQVYHYAFATYAPYIIWRYVADVIKAVVHALLLPPVVRALGKEQKS